MNTYQAIELEHIRYYLILSSVDLHFHSELQKAAIVTNGKDYPDTIQKMIITINEKWKSYCAQTSK